MCTLMQKDVLIELVAYLRAFFISRDSTNPSPRVPEQDELLKLRSYLYNTPHEQINFEALRDRLLAIQAAFNISL